MLIAPERRNIDPNPQKDNPDQLSRLTEDSRGGDVSMRLRLFFNQLVFRS
jgi:hypothetical protein